MLSWSSRRAKEAPRPAPLAWRPGGAHRRAARRGGQQPGVGADSRGAALRGHEGPRGPAEGREGAHVAIEQGARGWIEPDPGEEVTAVPARQHEAPGPAGLPAGRVDDLAYVPEVDLPHLARRGVAPDDAVFGRRGRLLAEAPAVAPTASDLSEEPGSSTWGRWKMAPGS
jgi:hypothetical protein